MVLPERWEDTELVRYEQRSEPIWGIALIAVLALAMLGMGAFFAAGILGFTYLAPGYLGLLLAAQVMDVALITIVYYKWFLPHMVIARDEHPDDVLW